MNALRQIALFDTATASSNLGDQIIMDAIRREVSELFPDCFIPTAASHEYMSAKSRGFLRDADLAIASGTNLLSSRMWFRSPWKVKAIDALTVHNVVLMGCGWYQYQRQTDPYSAWLLRSILSWDHIHSVRDSYTKSKLKALGFEKVINTGCPTIWRLTPELCQALPKHKSDAVVTTVNTYMKDPEADGRMLRVLREHYDRVYFWVQSREDMEYANSLTDGLDMVPPSLSAFDRLLATAPSLDYVGNRLHGGIRALQKGRRAIIVEIDNRAAEMGTDFNLATIARSEMDRLADMISGPLEIRVRPPFDAIEAWKAQFTEVLG